MDFHRIALQIESHVRHVQEIVGEILLDHVTTVAAANDEVVHPMRRVHFHDVPKHRLATDLDHRLRPEHRFLGHPGAEPTGEYYGFHECK
jgi:hypothetical protein